MERLQQEKRNTPVKKNVHTAEQWEKNVKDAVHTDVRHTRKSHVHANARVRGRNTPEEHHTRNLIPEAINVLVN